MSEHNYFPKYITRLPRIARLFFKKIGFLHHAPKFPLALDSEPSYTCSTLHKTLNVGAKEEMMEATPFKGWITFEDALRVERLLVPRKIWSISGVTTIIVVMAIAVKVMSIETSWPFTVFFLAITVTFLAVLFWLMQRSNLKAKRKYYNKDLIERSGTVAVDKLTVVTDKTKMEMQWDLFDKVIEANDLILAAKEKEYVAFAPYMFSTKQDWETCQEIVKRNKK